jgi:hypothetical protein
MNSAMISLCNPVASLCIKIFGHCSAHADRIPCIRVTHMSANLFVARTHEPGHDMLFGTNYGIQHCHEYLLWGARVSGRSTAFVWFARQPGLA